MWCGKANIIFCFLIPVIIAAQNNQDPDDYGYNVRMARFGFGGIERLRAAWKSVCNETCPRRGRFLFVSRRTFCALKCPESLYTATTIMPGPMKPQDPPKPQGTMKPQAMMKPQGPMKPQDMMKPQVMMKPQNMTKPQDPMKVQG